MKLKYTQYFSYVRNRPDRACIKEKWIERAINNPVHTEIQLDGRIRKWVKIEEKGKFLRVLLLQDEKTVHNEDKL